MDGDLSAIRQLSDRWIAALAAGEVETFADLVTDDIVVVHGNGRVVAGVREVLEDLRSGVERARVEQVVQPCETVVFGEYAFERARVHTRLVSRFDRATHESDSQTFSILRKDRTGQWRVARVIGVVERPDPTL